MALRPDGKVRWESLKPAPTPTGQGDLFAGVSFQTRASDITLPAVRRNVGEQLALAGFLENTPEPSERPPKKVPKFPPSDQRKTQLTPTVSPEQQKTVEDRRLRIDLTLSRLVALTEEQKDDIRDTIQNVLDSAKGKVEKEEGTYYVHEGDVKILKENINTASHDEFELYVDGDTIYFIGNPEGEEAIHTGWHATVKRSFQIKPSPKRVSVA